MTTTSNLSAGSVPELPAAPAPPTSASAPAGPQGTVQGPAPVVARCPRCGWRGYIFIPPLQTSADVLAAIVDPSGHRGMAHADVVDGRASVRTG